VRTVRGDFTVEAARQYLARFRFWGDDPLRVVSGFSGGERSRLALAKLLLEPRNLLFLDEPTNHLDIPAAEILEEALVGFEGTVILVSHDRRFLENVTTRIVSVRDGVVDVYPGGFRDYVAAHLAPQDRDDAPQSARGERGRGKKEATSAVARDDGSSDKKGGSPDEKKASYEAQRAAARDKEKKKKRVEELERLIADGERQLEQMRAALREDPGGDWAKLAKKAAEEQALSKRVEQMMAEWAKLSEGA
jgi:ATP-binding cassette, subfamily F, member 3